MQLENLLIEIKENILYITINRPKNLNALNIKTIVELDEVFEEYMYNDDVKGVILTGAGEKSFVAGADIQELAVATALEAQSLALHGQRVFRRLAVDPASIAARALRGNRAVRL